jgi:hypothetical protein
MKTAVVIFDDEVGKRTPGIDCETHLSLLMN